MRALLVLLVLLGSIFQGVAMFKTWIVRDYGVGYWGPLGRDGVWHEALVGQLEKNIVPNNPGLAGIGLSNYHYFYNLLVHVSHVASGIEPRFFIYVFFPIVFSVLLGVGTYKLASVLFKDKLTSILAVYFVYFGSSFGWIIEYLHSGELGGESAFWANQPVSMNLNPPFAISLVMMIFIVLLLRRYLRRPSWLLGILLGLLSGVLIGFKAYAGVLVLGALLVLSAKRLILNRDYGLSFVFVFSLIVALGVYLPRNSGSGGLIEVLPFWLVDTMIDAGDRVGIPHLTARRFAYLNDKKWFHYGAVEILAISIFFVGNLGTRIVGLYGIGKKNLRDDTHIFIFLMMGAAGLLPLLFVQKGNPWNVIQFFYYLLFFASLWTSVALVKFYRRFRGVYARVLVGIFLILTPLSSIGTFRSWLYPNPPSFLPIAEKQALEFLSEQEDGVVLKHNFDSTLRAEYSDPFPLVVYAESMYVSAYSGKEVYLEDIEQQIVLDTNFRDRQRGVEEFFSETDLEQIGKFLREEKIKYVYLPKVYFLPLAEGDYPMRKIFENEEVNIYEVVEL